MTSVGRCVPIDGWDDDSSEGTYSAPLGKPRSQQMQWLDDVLSALVQDDAPSLHHLCQQATAQQLSTRVQMCGRVSDAVVFGNDCGRPGVSLADAAAQAPGVDFVWDLGDTPLHLAAKNGRAACVRLLMRCGADARAYNREGRTPKAEATMECRLEIIGHLHPEVAERQRAELELGPRPATPPLVAADAGAAYAHVSTHTHNDALQEMQHLDRAEAGATATAASGSWSPAAATATAAAATPDAPPTIHDATVPDLEVASDLPLASLSSPQEEAKLQQSENRPNCGIGSEPELATSPDPGVLDEHCVIGDENVAVNVPGPTHGNGAQASAEDNVVTVTEAPTGKTANVGARDGDGEDGADDSGSADGSGEESVHRTMRAPSEGDGQQTPEAARSVSDPIIDVNSSPSPSPSPALEFEVTIERHPEDGLGLVLDHDGDGQVETVVGDIIEGSPADLVQSTEGHSIKIDDTLTHVNSEPIYGLTFETVLERLSSSHASRVTLRFVREPEQLPVQTASERKKSHGIIMKRGSNLGGMGLEDVVQSAQVEQMRANGEPVTETGTPATASSSQLRMTGRLFKKGGGSTIMGRRNWKERYFVLQLGGDAHDESATLKYYRPNGDHRRLGSISLRECAEVVRVTDGTDDDGGSNDGTADPKRMHRFNIVPHHDTGSAGRWYQLRAHSAEEMEEWIESISAAIRLSARGGIDFDSDDEAATS